MINGHDRALALGNKKRIYMMDVEVASTSVLQTKCLFPSHKRERHRAQPRACHAHLARPYADGATLPATPRAHKGSTTRARTRIRVNRTDDKLIPWYVFWGCEDDLIYCPATSPFTHLANAQLVADAAERKKSISFDGCGCK